MLSLHDFMILRIVLFFQLFELIWDKVGKQVNLTVLRPNDGSQQYLSMIIDNVGPNEINR